MLGFIRKILGRKDTIADEEISIQISHEDQGRLLRNLNHPRVHRITPSIAVEIGLSPGFRSFVFSESRPEVFRYRVESLDHTWTCFIPDHIEKAYALWSCNADQTLVCLTGEERSFWHGYHDDPEPTFVARTEQGLLFDLFVGIYESDLPPEVMEFASQSASFRYLENLIDWYRENSDEDFFQTLRKQIDLIDNLEDEAATRESEPSDKQEDQT